MAESGTKRGIRVAIDRGGTFTDCIANFSSGRLQDDVVIKLLSVDPSNYDDAPLEGIRRLLSKFEGREIPRGEPLDTATIDSIRMGTTVATNALLERKGETIAMVVTKGFKDCLEIGNQSRPNIFDLAIRKPEVLYKTVVEIDERVTLEDYAEDPERHVTDAPALDQSDDATDLVKGLSGETVRVLKRPDQGDIRAQLQALRDSGIKSIAVCLMHGYTYPTHEALVGRIARGIGFQHVSLSHELMPMIKLVPRANSACADAYLTPAIRKYIDGFQAGFSGGLGAESVKRQAKGARCEFMQSDGGLVDVDGFSGLRAILSGPAGGVVGYALTSYDPSTKTPVIGFDMGGTSTDVSRYGNGRYEHVFETTTAGVTIQSPQLDINTVAAGGGSRLFWRNGLFVVGPESAGAHPGPACYRKGGPLTITDANLFLGRLLPDFFPQIFGESEDQGLDEKASENLFKKLADQINQEQGKQNNAMTVDEVAHGFLKIANETMARPIRSLTEARGYDTSKHRLATFGGAGGQHAVAIAESLGISQVLIHRHSSVLSAYGMALADLVDEQQEPESKIWSDQTDDRKALQSKMEELKKKSAAKLQDQGFSQDRIHFEEYLNMRYHGTESSLMIIRPNSEEAKEYGGDDWNFGKAFEKQHLTEFGFTFADRDIIVDDVRVRGIGKTFEGMEKTVDQQLKQISPKDLKENEKVHSRRSVHFDGGRQSTAVYKLEDLEVGNRVRGPAIIADGTQTIVVSPSSTAIVIETHVVINIGEGENQDNTISTEQVDPILLSVFGHRFMAIAEQMGRALQKTSVSTNVKERLDYSCALFDADCGLLANAPHLPVHLGSIFWCVRTQAALWRGKLKRGDVLVSNSPMYGGTHLPDITVVTPAFNDKEEIIFYVASRAHHADIGGILPGSMPPHSRELYQEGAIIKSEKLVSEGHFNEKRMTELLYDEPAQYPGCSGTRCLQDNISDLKAQVAANQKGISLISNLMEDFGEEVVQFYMRKIQENAEQSVRNLLKDVSKRFKGQDLSAVDHMDDGSPIKLKISIDGESGEAVFDFEGTGPQVYSNTNAPEAVTHSAIIYCLRCLVDQDIPLNQGCLAPVTIKIPKKSFLSPSGTAAVVGGNVMTSQRVTDVVLKAFKACAASQGDCNNLTFGRGGNIAGQKAEKGFGYYETIAGGSGAGPDWDGTSGVHTHMTNTRITDSEVFERRYPVLLREFSLRANSHGAGQHPGGDGVIRDIEFRIPVQVSILSERRVFHPYGLEGGEDAQCGQNVWVRQVPKMVGSDADKGNLRITNQPQHETPAQDEEQEAEVIHIDMGGKNTASMQPGDRIIVKTPGGGGWGPVGAARQVGVRADAKQAWKGGSIASRQAEAEASA